MRKGIRPIIGLVIVAAFISACAGARGALVFDQLKYPVSSSPYLYAPDGRPVTVNELHTVGQVSWVKRFWGMFWGLVPLSGTLDVSDHINEQIKHVDGDGVINLRISVQNCMISYLPVINILPFYPGCSLVRMNGDIVKLMEAPPPPAPVAPPAPPAPEVSHDTELSSAPIIPTASDLPPAPPPTPPPQPSKPTEAEVANQYSNQPAKTYVRAIERSERNMLEITTFGAWPFFLHFLDQGELGESHDLGTYSDSKLKGRSGLGWVAGGSINYCNSRNGLILCAGFMMRYLDMDLTGKPAAYGRLQSFPMMVHLGMGLGPKDWFGPGGYVFMGMGPTINYFTKGPKITQIEQELSQEAGERIKLNITTKPGVAVEVGVNLDFWLCRYVSLYAEAAYLMGFSQFDPGLDSLDMSSIMYNMVQFGGGVKLWID